MKARRLIHGAEPEVESPDLERSHLQSEQDKNDMHISLLQIENFRLRRDFSFSRRRIGKCEKVSDVLCPVILPHGFHLSTPNQNVTCLKLPDSQEMRNCLF